MRASAALPVAVVVVLLAVAGGAWFLAGRGSSRGPGALGAPGARAPVAAAPVGTTALEGGDAPRSDGTAETDRAVLREEAPAAAEEQAGAVVARLAGRVVDPQGAPVAGAEVRLERGPELGPLRRARSDAGAARAGADGRFALEVGEGGARHLRIDAPGFAPFARGVDLVAGVSRDLGALRLDRGVVLAGRVVDPSGRPVPGVPLHRPPDFSGGFVPLFADPGEVVATTDDDGRFVVDRQAVGAWSLVAVPAEYPQAVAEGRTDRPGERVEGIVIALEEGASIEGRVVDRPDGRSEVLRVRADPSAARRPSVLEAGEPALVDRRSAEVGADGTFRLAGLRPGETYALVLVASDAGRGAIALPFFGGRVRGRLEDVRAGARDVELAYDPGAALVLQVVDGRSGAPLEDFEVEAGTAWPQPLLGDDGRTLRRHPEGRVRYEGLRPSTLHPTITLRVHAVGYEDYEREGIEIEGLAAGEEVDLGVVRLTPVAVVRVHVRERSSGEPVVGARVTLAAPDEEGGRFEMRRRISSDDDDDGPVVTLGPAQSGRSDENGVCTLNRLEGGSGRVSVRAEGFAPFESEVITLPARAFDYEVELSRGGAVEVRVVDATGEPIAGAFVEHRAGGAQAEEAAWVLGDDDRQGARTDAAGLARFDHLAPGGHAFRVGEGRSDPSGFQVRIEGIAGPDAGGDWSEVFVPEGERVGLTLLAPPRARLEGVVTQGGEPLPGAQVRVLPAASEGPVMPPWMTSHRSARTDSSGRYELEDLRVDEYRLEIQHESRAMPAEVEIALAEGDNRRDVELPLSVVEGRITDPDGEPVAGARVRAERAGAQETGVRVMVAFTTDGDDAHTSVSTGDPLVEAETDADGRYVLRGVLCDTDLVVEARGGAFEPTRSETFQVAPDAVRDGVDVVLRAAGTLEVLVLDASGAPVAQALVQASYSGESEEFVEPKVAVAKADGRAVLRGLRPGEWSVGASRIGGGGGPPEPGARTPVEVVAGETARVTVEAP